MDNAADLRRELFARSGLGLAGLALGQLGDAPAFAQPAGGAGQTSLMSKAPPFPAKAKHVIHLFMNGGPSHVDTFDPKPSLAKYAGKPLPTANLPHRTQDGSGVSLALQVPQVRQERDRSQRAVSQRRQARSTKSAVIRSMHADVPNHEPSLMLMNCGDARLIRPSLGSWITYGLGTKTRTCRASSPCVRAAIRSRNRRTGRRVPAGRLPGNLHRHAAHRTSRS